MEEWVRVLQNVVQRNALKLLLSQEDQKPTVQGWLIKVKHGHQKKCWCVLIGKMFIYFRTPNEQVSQERQANQICAELLQSSLNFLNSSVMMPPKNRDAKLQGL